MIRPTHRHLCRCGTELRCTQPPDQCAVEDGGRSGYECPTCQHARFDSYLTQEELTRHETARRFPREIPESR